MTNEQFNAIIDKLENIAGTIRAATPGSGIFSPNEVLAYLGGDQYLYERVKNFGDVTNMPAVDLEYITTVLIPEDTDHLCDLIDADNDSATDPFNLAVFGRGCHSASTARLYPNFQATHVDA